MHLYLRSACMNIFYSDYFGGVGFNPIFSDQVDYFAELVDVPDV